mgnify:CR=1 FL=1
MSKHSVAFRFPRCIFDKNEIEQSITQLQLKTTQPDFWVNQKAAQKVLKNISLFENELKMWDDLESHFHEVQSYLELIEEGGWHFTNIKKPEEIEKKMRSYLHHHEYDLNPLGIQKIKQLIKERKALYNIKTDMRLSKFDDHPNLKLLDLNKLPNYIYDNQDKFTDWIEK